MEGKGENLKNAFGRETSDPWEGNCEREIIPKIRGGGYNYGLKKKTTNPGE